MNDDVPQHPVSVDDQRPVDLQRAEPIVLERWRGLAIRVLADEGMPPAAELTLSFVDEAAMTELNVEHMDGDGPTDVLAFPLDGPEVVAGAPGATSGPDEGPPIVLGDVVICPSIARRNAAQHGVTFEDELALLVVHGLLHILGHDHAEPDETETMRDREQFHLQRDRSASPT